MVCGSPGINHSGLVKIMNQWHAMGLFLHVGSYSHFLLLHSLHAICIVLWCGMVLCLLGIVSSLLESVQVQV